MLSKLFWLGLSRNTRTSLKILLEIPKSEGAEVFGNTVVSDGHTDADLATLTLEKLQEYMRSDNPDFYGLLNELIDRIENPVNISPPTPLQDAISVEERLEVVEHQVEELKPSNKVLYDIPIKPIQEKKPHGRPKGSKVVNGKLVFKK